MMKVGLFEMVLFKSIHTLTFLILFLVSLHRAVLCFINAGESADCSTGKAGYTFLLFILN